MKSIEPFAGSFMFHPSTMPEANLASHIRILLEFVRLLPNCSIPCAKSLLLLEDIDRNGKCMERRGPASLIKGSSQAAAEVPSIEM